MFLRNISCSSAAVDDVRQSTSVRCGTSHESTVEANNAYQAHTALLEWHDGMGGR